MGSILHIAIGTAIGVLVAVLIVVSAWRWHRLFKNSDGRRRVGMELLGAIGAVACAVAVPEAYRWASDQYRRSVELAASKRQFADEVENCRLNKDAIVERAVAPLTEPLDAMGINRWRTEFTSNRVGGWPTFRSAHGWLVLCHQRGIFSQNEYDGALALQRKNQEAFDKPELERRANRQDELDRLFGSRK